MDTHQRRTFLVYSRGIMPTEMTLGSLYLDPTNPLYEQRNRMDCPSGWDKTEGQNWIAPTESDELCSLKFNASYEWLIDAQLLDMASAWIGDDVEEEVSIVAQSGRREQIRKPEDVLNDVVLCRPEAADWLANCLSVSRMMYYLKLGSPKVWMLTGIQYLTDVVVSTSHRKSKNVGVSIEAPLPDPTGIAISLLTGLSTAGMEARIQHQSKTDVAYSHEGERIWAAQFAPLDVRYIKKGVEGEKRLPGRILLKALPDLKHFGVRYGSPMMEEEDKDESDEENVDIKDTVANVTGLDWDKVRKMDEDPSLIQNDMLAVDWLTLGRYLHDSNRKH